MYSFFIDLFRLWWWWTWTQQSSEAMVSGDDDLMKRRAERRENGLAWWWFDEEKEESGNVFLIFQFILNKDIRVRVLNLRVHPNPKPDPDTFGLIKFNPNFRFNLFQYRLNPNQIFRIRPNSIWVRVKLPSLPVSRFYQDFRWVLILHLKWKRRKPKLSLIF